ncbi:MAG: hypothetical protein ACI3U2_11170 [Anaerovibrio sp.]
MKKCLQLLLMLCVLVLGAQSAFAGGLLGGTGVSEDRVYNQDGMLKIKTLAIAAPIYNGPKSEGEPDVEDLPEILMEGTLADKKGVLKYVSYRDVCQSIKVAKHVDILRLDRKKAFGEYKEAIGKYADAYVIVTVSNGTSMNDGTRLNLYFEVFDAKTNQIVYMYHKLAPKSATRDTLLYTEIAKDFYTDFIKAQEKVEEDKEKEAKAILKMERDAAKKAAKEAAKNK